MVLISASAFCLSITSVKKTLVSEKTYTENYVLQHEFAEMQGNCVCFGIKMLKMEFSTKVEAEKELFCVNNSDG